jgi:hypothetical protein
MAKQKKQEEAWITAQEAAVILTQNTDHPISADYVRMLAKANKIEYRDRDGRTNEYNPQDVRGYHVRPKNTPRVRPRPSTRTVDAEAGEKKQEAVA